MRNDTRKRRGTTRRPAALAATIAALLAAPAVALAAEAPAIETCAADSGNRAIAERYDTRWAEAFTRGDAASLEALYAESAVLMPPTDETFVGRTPIAEYLRSAPLPTRGADYSVDFVSCELRGNTLHVAGVWGAQGQAGRVTGNVLRVLEPAGNGRWISRYEIWN